MLVKLGKNIENIKKISRHSKWDANVIQWNPHPIYQQIFSVAVSFLKANFHIFGNLFSVAYKEHYNLSHTYTYTHTHHAHTHTPCTHTHTPHKCTHTHNTHIHHTHTYTHIHTNTHTSTICQRYLYIRLVI